MYTFISLDTACTDAHILSTISRSLTGNAEKYLMIIQILSPIRFGINAAVNTGLDKRSKK